MLHFLQGNTYKVTAKIKELVQNEQWWYSACTKCKRSTRPNGDSYKCYDTECIGTDAVPRYVAMISIPRIAPQIYGVAVVLTRCGYWENSGTKLLSLPLNQRLLRMQKRRQLRSFVLGLLQKKWLDYQLTTLSAFPQMYRDMSLNRSKGCMVPGLISSSVCPEAPFEEGKQLLELILSQELLTSKSSSLKNHKHVCIYLCLVNYAFFVRAKF